MTSPEFYLRSIFGTHSPEYGSDREAQSRVTGMSAGLRDSRLTSAAASKNEGFSTPEVERLENAA
ncbi:hypothetical protein [Burkholderia cenocepacia]|uniref:hypothetical protein n=1 Tax=Burkholderia cenocepacia TaxID=95486 RepID=UPI001365B4A3|nr:hypothetical protein [Burkholderia cenocepacia]